MISEDYLAILQQDYKAILREGVEQWNAWRHDADFLVGMRGETLRLDFGEAKFTGAKLAGAELNSTIFTNADLRGADLSEANLMDAYLGGADLRDADLTGAQLINADLSFADLRGANLTGANLTQACLTESDLSEATLTRAGLFHASLVETKLDGAVLHQCFVYGASVWNVSLDGAFQSGLIISNIDEETVVVEDIEVAQFIYLLLKNQNLRKVIHTVGERAVLILGRFTDRKHILDAIRDEVRNLGYLPIIFDFERPQDKDFTETVQTLAGLSRFIVADITKPSSVPLEAHAVIPNYMVPFVPIIQKGEVPFAMFRDLWQKHRDWVLDPLAYESVEQLVKVFQRDVVEPANKRLTLLRRRKAEEIVFRTPSDSDT